MFLQDLSIGTLFQEVYGDESHIIWRIVSKHDDIGVALCSIVGKRSISVYKSFKQRVVLYPTQLKLF